MAELIDKCITEANKIYDLFIEITEDSIPNDNLPPKITKIELDDSKSDPHIEENITFDVDYNKPYYYDKNDNIIDELPIKINDSRIKFAEIINKYKNGLTFEVADYVDELLNIIIIQYY